MSDTLRLVSQTSIYVTFVGHLFPCSDVGPCTVHTSRLQVTKEGVSRQDKTRKADRQAGRREDTPVHRKMFHRETPARRACRERRDDEVEPTLQEAQEDFTAGKRVRDRASTLTISSSPVEIGSSLCKLNDAPCAYACEMIYMHSLSPTGATYELLADLPTSSFSRPVKTISFFVLARPNRETDHCMDTSVGRPAEAQK